MGTEKRVTKFDLKLTRSELVHLRDLMGVSLPAAPPETVSHMLARAESREAAEESLWNKVTEACAHAGLAMEDDAPDYVVAPTSAPMMAVFRIQEDADLVEVPLETEESQGNGTEEVRGGADPVRGPEQADEGDTLPGGRGADEEDDVGKQRRVPSKRRKKRGTKGAE